MHLHLREKSAICEKVMSDWLKVTYQAVLSFLYISYIQLFTKLFAII